MSTVLAPPSSSSSGPKQTLTRKESAAIRYGLSLALVALATLGAFIIFEVAGAPNVTLVFVLAVVIAATRLGFGPALAASVASVLAFDFFFAPPYYSLRIDSSSDIAAAGLLLVIAAIVSTVAGEARRRALSARRDADRAGALHDVAHLVVQAAPSGQVEAAAAAALTRVFQAPSVVLVEQAGKPARIVGAMLSPVEQEAAQWSLENQKPLRGENYPFETSTFDFWPVCRQGAPRIAIGVICASDHDQWPDDPARYIELVGAYLASSLTMDSSRLDTQAANTR